MSLEGKVALVTGAASGIGAATAKRFVTDGAKVCLVDINADVLKQTADSLPPESVISCVGDVTSLRDVERMVQTTLNRWGRLHILVNSAGIDPPTIPGKFDLDLWHRILEVNLTGPFLTMKTAIPRIIEAGGGSVINVASLAGVRFFEGKTEYSASKGGLIALTQQASVQYGSSHVRCNVICPGGVRTPMLEKNMKVQAQRLGKDLDSLITELTAYTPLGRIGRPEEIAGICRFLAGEDSSLINGGVLLADYGASVMDVNGIAMRQGMMKLEEDINIKGQSRLVKNLEKS